MMKLNNKGITTIEVIICFILVVTITTAMYGTIASYNQKRVVEQYKEEIYTYKNLVTKEIQDDFIKIGITHAEYKEKIEGPRITYTVDCVMKDGTTRRLRVIKEAAGSEHNPQGRADKDYYMISYGNPVSNDMIDYPIPDFGFTKQEKVKTDTGYYFKESEHGKVVKDLIINNVEIEIKSDNVLDIYIGFYHPELGRRYGIQVITPIDYVSTGRDSSSNLNLIPTATE